MNSIKLLLPICVVTPALLLAQNRGVDTAAQLRPPTDSWPTYSGDLTGRRYSPLKNIDKTTVKQLSLAWVSRGFTDGVGPTGRAAVPAGSGGGGGGGRGGTSHYQPIMRGSGKGGL